MQLLHFIKLRFVTYQHRLHEIHKKNANKNYNLIVIHSSLRIRICLLGKKVYTNIVQLINKGHKKNPHSYKEQGLILIDLILIT